MNVKLISVTQSLIRHETEDRVLTPEELIIFIARVSNPGNQQNHATAERLTAYLIRNKHWSPFEQVHITFEVKTSRVVAAQVLRHWSMRFQEFSQRYAEVTEMEPVEIRRQSSGNHQGGDEVFDPYIYVEPIKVADIIDQYSFSCKASDAIAFATEVSLKVYQALLKADVAKESARFILPLRTSTTIYLTGNVRDFLFYLMSRTNKHAQKEHRQVAERILSIFSDEFPNIYRGVFLDETGKV